MEYEQGACIPTLTAVCITLSQDPRGEVIPLESDANLQAPVLVAVACSRRLGSITTLGGGRFGADRGAVRCTVPRHSSLAGRYISHGSRIRYVGVCLRLRANGNSTNGREL